MASGSDIVLFDAECVLCSYNAQLILTYDRTRRFRLASMQGEVGSRLYIAHDMDPRAPESLLVVTEGGTLRDSDAVLHIYRHLAPPWRWLAALRIVPRTVRDPVYRWIARNRYRLFGRRQTCWVPASADRDRIL
jgi:predicted DCC family thiol-disulfide oxidoreductase YuxK